MISFKQRHFKKEMILMLVRWFAGSLVRSLRIKLS